MWRNWSVVKWNRVWFRFWSERGISIRFDYTFQSFDQSYCIHVFYLRISTFAHVGGVLSRDLRKRNSHTLGSGLRRPQFHLLMKIDLMNQPRVAYSKTKPTSIHWLSFEYKQKEQPKTNFLMLKSGPSHRAVCRLDDSKPNEKQHLCGIIHFSTQKLLFSVSKTFSFSSFFSNKSKRIKTKESKSSLHCKMIHSIGCLLFWWFKPKNKQPPS